VTPTQSRHPNNTAHLAGWLFPQGKIGRDQRRTRGGPCPFRQPMFILRPPGPGGIGLAIGPSARQRDGGPTIAGGSPQTAHRPPQAAGHHLHRRPRDTDRVCRLAGAAEFVAGEKGPTDGRNEVGTAADGSAHKTVGQFGAGTSRIDLCVKTTRRRSTTRLDQRRFPLKKQFDLIWETGDQGTGAPTTFLSAGPLHPRHHARHGETRTS